MASVLTFSLAFATCADINHELDPNENADAQIASLFTITLSSMVKSFLKESAIYF